MAAFEGVGEWQEGDDDEAKTVELYFGLLKEFGRGGREMVEVRAGVFWEVKAL